MIAIYECVSSLEVETPMGRGNIWLVKDYGPGADTLYSVIIQDGKEQGMIFDFPNSEIRVSSNFTIGRGSWHELKGKIEEAPPSLDPKKDSH